MNTKKLPDTIAKRTLRDLELTSQTDAYGVEFGVLASKDQRCTVLASIRADAAAAATTRFLACLEDWSRWAGSLGLEDRVCGLSLSIQTWENGDSSAVVGLSFTGRPRPTGERQVLRRPDLVEEISTHLARVLDGLRVTAPGLTVQVCTAQDITDLARSAFDASIAEDIEAARASGAGTGLSWADAPPRPEATGQSFYAHDRVVSTSWSVATRDDEDLPPVDLATALVPTPGVLCKRATLIFRISPTLAARLAPFGLVLTADVQGVQDIPMAQQLPARQTIRSRLRMRAAVDTQDTTFLAGLPLDLATPHTVMIPREMKEIA